MSEKLKNSIKDLSNIKMELSNIESFLIKSNYDFIYNIEKNNFKKYIETINKIASKKDYLLNFEFNEKISFSEVSVKYGILIQSLNKIFLTNLTIQDMYEQYLEFTKDLISLNQYLNSLILIEFFFTNFNGNKNIINYDKIEIYDISTLDENKNELKNKLNNIYTKIKEKENFKGNKINLDLIILVLFSTLGNKFFIDKNIPDIKNLFKYFTEYNKIFTNSLNLSLFLYFNTIIAINLYLNSMKYKKKFLNYENSLTNKLLYIEFTENEKIPEINIDKNNIHTLYLYDNENIMFNEENYNDAIKLLQFQNYLKIYALYHLNKIKMKITINLYIGTIYDLLIQIKNSKKVENKLLEENIFNYIEDNLSDLNLSKFNLFQKENIIDVFNNFNFFDLSLFVTGYKSDFNISKIIVNNLNLIKKSKNIFLQESTLFNFQESSLENLINSFLILHYLLETFRKNMNLQKNCSNLFLIKFKFFKCTMNVIKKKRRNKNIF